MQGEHVEPVQDASLDRIRINVTEPEKTKCPQPVGIFRSGEMVIPAPCKKWDCPHCGKVKLNRIRDSIRDGYLVDIRDNEKLPDTERVLRSITLTQHTDDDTPIMIAWARLRSYLHKIGYTNLRFFLVKEFTRRGKRHLHVLVNRHINHSDLKHGWSNATDRKSFIVWISRVNMKITSPGGYMTKYITKSMHTRQFKKYEHRFSHDRRTNWKPYTMEPWATSQKWTFEYNPSPVKASSMFREALTAARGEKDGPGRPLTERLEYQNGKGKTTAGL